jgi:hypothetical protein
MLQAGIPPDSVIQYDGSGLARHDLITPSSAVQLYTYMSKSRYANIWRDVLTIGELTELCKIALREPLLPEMCAEKPERLTRFPAFRVM